MRNLNVNIYGTPADWENPFANRGDVDGEWCLTAWHDTHWIYDPANDTGQEYNYNPDNSVALWGIRGDCAAAQKSILGISTIGNSSDALYLGDYGGTTTETVRESEPYIAYFAKGYGSDEPPSLWVSPVAQFSSDINASDDDFKPSTRLPDNPHVGATTIYGWSSAVTRLNKKNFVVVPEVRFAKYDENEDNILLYMDGAPLNLSSCEAILAQGYFPVSIKMNSMYVGPEVPDENNPRTAVNYTYIGQNRVWMLADVIYPSNYGTHLPDILKTYYNSIDVPDISATRRVISADSEGVYEQGPFMAYDTIGNAHSPGGQGQTTGIVQYYASLGCYSRKTFNVITPDFYQLNFKANWATMEFDDVNYTWGNIIPYIRANSSDWRIVTTADNIYNQEILFISALNITDAKGLSKKEAYMKAILHECATVGWWFAEDPETAVAKATGTTTDGEGIYLPLLENGITTGLYVTGEDIADNEQADWGDTLDIDYEPNPYDDVTPDGRTGDWTYNLHNFDLDSNKYHVLDTTKWGLVRAIILGYHTVHDPVSGTDILVANLADYGGVNAGDWITCLYWYPFNLPRKETTLVMAGPLYLGAHAPLWDENSNSNTYHLGEYEISDRTMAYKDFRGFNYCKIYLRLPFYGDFELDLHRYYGGKIKVDAIVDFSTAHGTYYIYSYSKSSYSWFLFDTVDFKCGIQLPMNSVGMGTYQNQMHVAEKQLTNAKLALAGSVATAMVGAGLGVAIATGSAAVESAKTALKLGIGGGAGSLASGSKIEDAKYALEHTAPNPGKCLPASPFCAGIQDLSVRIIFVYPQVPSGYGKDSNGHKLAEYGKTTGFACLQQGTLNGLGLTGLTVCSNIRFNTHTQVITTLEMTLIENAIKAGIIV